MSSDEDNKRPSVPAPDADDDTGELPPLLAPGDVLAGRYRIQSVMPGPEGIAYRAEDLRRCPNCRSVTPPSEVAHCPVCGASLEHRPLCTIRLVAGSPRPATAGGAEVLDVHGLVFLMVPDDASQDMRLPPRGIRLRVGMATDPGRVRQSDEDSLLAINFTAFHLGRAETSLGLYAVADGIGGLASGALASHLVLDHLARHFGPRALLADPGNATPERLLADLAEAVQEANGHLYEQQHQAGHERTMGTTITAAYVYGARVAVANVGDSRTYRWHNDRLEQLTDDHSVVASLVRAGLARPEEIRTHPQKSLITRSMGEQPFVEVDTFLSEIAPGDRLVLCCDGVWEMLRDEDMAAILRAEPDVQRAATRVIARANANGGEDNLSVIVVAVDEVGAEDAE